MKLQFDSDLSINRFDTQIPIMIHSQKKKTNAMKSMNKMNSLNKMSKKNGLKKMLRKGKADIISKDFKTKLKRLIAPSQVPQKLLNFEMEPSNKWQILKHKMEETQGLNISYRLVVGWALLNLCQTIAITFIASVMLAFIQNKQNRWFISLIYVSCFLHLIDVILNSTLQRIQNGRKLRNLKQIYSYYVASELKIDILYLISLILLPFRIHIAVDMCIQVLVFLKMFKSVDRVGLFEHIYLTIMSMEKYYQVIKVILLNFTIAHIIAIVLILMCHLSEDNWIVKHGLQSVQWTQKYTWSYYWGVTIMLTVGFGDFAATNKNQALLLIFIETFSCILLAYNINTVGVILNQIRIKQRERKKRLRVFMRVADEQNIPSSLTKQIASFIGQSFQIKDKFQYQEYQNVIESLPSTIQSQFKMESNKHIFSKIPFINLLCKKSIYNLAQKIHIKIAHPQQIISKKGQLINLAILKKGKIALCCKIVKDKCNKNKLDGWAVQTLQSKNSHQAKLLSLDFLKNRVYEYDVKSLDYSVLYETTLPQIIQSIRDRQFDYELLCEMRDKDEYYLHDNQIYNCQYCKNQKHNVFRCPMLQYMPLKRHVIFKNIKKQNQIRSFKESRDKYHKRKKNQFKVLEGISIVQCQYEVFVEMNLLQTVSLAKGSYKSVKNFIKVNCEKRYKQNLLSETKVKDLMSSINTQQDIDNKITIQGASDLEASSVHRGFWDLECDTIEDFHHYFKHNNAESINKNCLSILKQKSFKFI